MMKLLSGKNGFSLVEVMVGVGLLCGVGLLVVQQAQTVGKNQQGLAAEEEVESAVSNIAVTLSKRHHCSATLADGPLDGIYLSKEPESATGYLSESFKRLSPLYKLNEEVGKFRIKVSQIQLITKGDSDKTDYLRVSFQIPGEKRIAKDFRLTINRDSAGKVISCSSEIGNEIEEGLAQACKSVEATYDEKLKKCIPTNLPECFFSENSCSSSEASPDIVYRDNGNQEFSEYSHVECLTKFNVSPIPACASSSATSVKCTRTNPEAPAPCDSPSTCFYAVSNKCEYKFKSKILKLCCRVLRNGQMPSVNPLVVSAPPDFVPSGQSPLGGSSAGGGTAADTNPGNNSGGANSGGANSGGANSGGANSGGANSGGGSPNSGCIPSGGIDDTLGKTHCCSGRAVPGSTQCANPQDYGTTWLSCTQICE